MIVVVVVVVLTAMAVEEALCFVVVVGYVQMMLIPVAIQRSQISMPSSFGNASTMYRLTRTRPPRHSP